MTEPLPKTYDFASTEQRLYAWWESSGYFRPKIDPHKKPFVISIPPPNVTGELHLGHAMFVAVEDLMIRYHRMKGDPTLWVPGSDHAGIATQLQVEKMLLRDEEVTREELGRDEFVKRAWQWKEKYGGIIYDQLRRLGASCDWERTRFTLDPGLSRAVRRAFVTLYRKGLIYRGPRLVNWSPGLKTAVSDLEVEYSEEQGTLYFFKYRLKDSNDYLPVATTRPETILGDTAVAVHPEDDRYRAFVGKTALVPILNREILVIADEAVDREFGTGAVKVTPGHDAVDYAIGQRHNLAIINVMNKDATVNDNAGPYAGQDRFVCRENLWKDMQKAGLTIKTQPHTLNVPRTQRGGEIVEPLISTQWFVTIKPLAEAAIAAVKDGRIQIVPERFEKVYFNWLENIKDWCISRQLWWGHRIPVWYCADCGKQTCAEIDPAACEHCGSKNIEQDPDVLDTWFSSGLWPFSTLGWPEETDDLKYFYPTSTLETGYDILFFWVARMIMMGLEFTGRAPFDTVYLHGIIRDEQGRKMSKTLGNVLDPRWIIDGVSGETLRQSGTSDDIARQFPDGIPAMGTDALRFTLLTSSTPGNDMNLSLKRVEGNRNFANKLWNAARFIIANLDRSQTSPDVGRSRETSDSKPTLADQWIRARLIQVIADVNRLFENSMYGEAGRQVYDFFWSEFADWYIEIAKLQLAPSPVEEHDGGGERPRLTLDTLVTVLDQCMRLLHPFTPYVTEEIWQHLRKACLSEPGRPAPAEGWAEALIVAKWPEAPTPALPHSAGEGVISDFTHIMEIIRAIRNARSENKVELGKKIAATIVAGDKEKLIASQHEAIARLANIEPTQFRIFATLPEKPKDAAAMVIGGTEIYLPLAGMVDAAAERERTKKEIEGLDKQIAKLETLLGSDFANKAPTAVVVKERAKLAEAKEARRKLAERTK
ncbi:MAG TPA: valine--tRNA ligase [Anaerolineales bacterium]|nr:valine--tRNA ligase [Anaerolineales bacterium]